MMNKRFFMDFKCHRFCFGYRARLWSLGALLLGMVAAPAQLVFRQPNIVFILTDDQGWADISQPLDPEHPEACTPVFETPNMNRLAEDSTIFVDAYSPAPICTPTRRSIQYGMTPARQHGTEFLSEFTGEGLFSIAEYIKEADPAYACAVFGKWGEAMSGRTWQEQNLTVYPEALGYDENDGRGGNAKGTFYHPKDKEAFKMNFIVEADEDPKRTFSLTNRSIDFMQRQVAAGRPFYLQINYYAIHTAYQARAETIEKYKDKPLPERKTLPDIGPMLEDLDVAVGQLYQAVEDLGIAENTVIVLASDNGGERSYVPLPQGSVNLPDRNAPLRQYKGSLYEGGIRVPFMISGPGIPRDAICTVPVALYDLLPTFYAMAGGKASLPDTMDGVSLLPLLEDPQSGDVDRSTPGLVFHRPKWKQQSHSALRQGDYKLVVTWAGPWEVKKLELFNLDTDIGETNNLAKKDPEKAKEMLSALLAYLHEVDAEAAPARDAKP